MFGVSSLHLRVVGLSCFIGLLSFKPSEPYLSQYLICNSKTFEQTCGSLTDEASCVSAQLGVMREDGYGAGSCTWSLNVGTGQSTQSCSPRVCSSYPIDSSGGAIRCADVNYCTPDKPSNTCVEELCYKNFSESEVNNYIYPWSTYAYLPALLFLCPMAELVSYRVAILIGIAGRVVTRFLLLFGTSLPAMQLMQVTYSIGTAAEDIFYAYVFYVFPTHMFQVALSTCRTSALISCLVASILGDLLVTQGDVPLTVLQIISCVAVCCGAFIGFFVILPSDKTRQFVEFGGVPLAAAGAGSGGLKGGGGAIDVAIGNFMLTTTSSTLPSSSTPRLDDDTTLKPDKTQTLAPTVAVGRSATPVPTRSEIWYQKSMIFLSQWSFFRSTLQRDPNLFNQVLYWIVANATFTEIFGYEVAVYQQLNGGSNRWNGSVLSVMLLLGAVGAMLPVYLKVDAPGAFSTNSINAVVSIAGVLGSVFLLVFAYVWKAIASLAMLSLFVACWQFISVIILVQVATELKRNHELTYGVGVRDIEVASYTAQGDDTGEDRDSLSKGVDSSSSLPPPLQAGEGAEPPSYAIAIVSLVGVSVVLQNLTVTIVFSGLQLGLQQALLVPCYLFAIASFLFVCASLRRWFRESPPDPNLE